MNHTPKIARWILSVTNRKRNRENVLGDFNEFYEDILEANGKKYANRWYWKQALKSIPNFLITSFYWGNVMFKNYLKIVFRNMISQKLFSSINVLGLALGMCVCMLAIIYINFELSYDTYHENSEDIYRVTLKYDTPSGYKAHFARSHESWTNFLPDDFPEIKSLVRFQWTPSVNLKIGEKKIRSFKWYYTDPEVFDVFSFPLLKGDPASALKEPKSVVITEKITHQYFGSVNPMGENILLMDETTGTFNNYKVTGVMKDLPVNSHFQIDYLVSYNNPESRQGWAWIYILLNPKSNPELLQTKLPDFIRKYGGEEAPLYSSFQLQRLTDIHLYSHLDREIEPNGDIQNIYIFSAVALLVLLIAGFNFMNLSTVRSVKRAKEVGIRKVLGACRKELIKYFIWESVIFSLLAFIIAFLVVVVVFPYFRNFLGNTISYDSVFYLPLMSGFFLIAITTGFISGIYPAFVLSSFDPLTAFLKGKKQTVSGKQFNFTLRRIMVVLQFTMSIVLIIFTLFSYHQFKFISNKKLGFNKDQILAIRNVSRVDQVKYSLFKNRLSEYPDIAGVSACMDVPSRDILDMGFTVAEGIHSGDESTVIGMQSVDNNFIDLMKMELIAGENFKTDDSYPSNVMTIEEMQQYIANKDYSYILNESAVKKLGWKTPEDALGKKLQWRNNVFSHSGRVAGVVKDFYQASLHLEIRPLILINEPVWCSNFLIKVSPKNIASSLGIINDTWNKIYPDSPIEYDFLDNLFEQLYRAEERQGELLSIFSILAVFIAYLGLFGLVSYTTEQRTKEIGIRKVMGASVSGVVVLLGKEFTKLILVSIFIAVPIGYYFVSQWLESFVYRANIEWGIFVVAGFISLFIALVTVSYQTIKAAAANPINSIKYE